MIGIRLRDAQQPLLEVPEARAYDLCVSPDRVEMLASAYYDVAAGGGGGKKGKYFEMWLSEDVTAIR